MDLNYFVEQWGPWGIILIMLLVALSVAYRLVKQYIERMLNYQEKQLDCMSKREVANQRIRSDQVEVLASLTEILRRVDGQVTQTSTVCNSQHASLIGRLETVTTKIDKVEDLLEQIKAGLLTLSSEGQVAQIAQRLQDIEEKLEILYKELKA